ncbi:keratin, type I cytoskeletal 9-like [Schistocerca piceifrons]|uniref:keratin, type I cytoskeletal 9-like n=1 Tax=Schistocerca piceifrons TaxID=274613 RepID=UPI001F5F893D|nr:keratin, type I cytoskeletal 9-like [Schistocerca piceifrons]
MAEMLGSVYSLQTGYLEGGGGGGGGGGCGDAVAAGHGDSGGPPGQTAAGGHPRVAAPGAHPCARWGCQGRCAELPEAGADRGSPPALWEATFTRLRSSLTYNGISPALMNAAFVYSGARERAQRQQWAPPRSAAAVCGRGGGSGGAVVGVAGCQWRGQQRAGGEDTALLQLAGKGAARRVNSSFSHGVARGWRTGRQTTLSARLLPSCGRSAGRKLMP